MPDCMFEPDNKDGAHIAKVHYCIDEDNRRCLVVTNLKDINQVVVGYNIEMEGHLMSVKHIKYELVRSNNEPLRRFRGN